MDLTYVLCPNVIGLLGLSILLVFTRFNFYLDKRELRLFVSAALVNMAIIVFEVGDFLLAQSPFPTAYWARRLTSATGFALTPLMPLLLAAIASRKKLPRIVMLPAALNVIMSYASMFTGHMFFITPENSYLRGPFFAVMLIISVFYLVTLVVISIKSIRGIRSSEAVFLLGIVAATVLGNVLEIAFSFHFVLWNCCAVLLITYYLFLHIQYFKYDPLTEVYNRNMFNHELAGLERKTDVSILSFDLNGLKHINDQEGHQRGDDYIVQCAQLLDRSFSSEGRLYRIGGDEFVVVVTGVAEDQIRRQLEEFQALCERENVSIAGGYTFLHTVTDTSQMIRDADRAMYDNKRNRMLNR